MLKTSLVLQAVKRMLGSSSLFGVFFCWHVELCEKILFFLFLSSSLQVFFPSSEHAVPNNKQATPSRNHVDLLGRNVHPAVCSCPVPDGESCSLNADCWNFLLPCSHLRNCFLKEMLFFVTRDLSEYCVVL